MMRIPVYSNAKFPYYARLDVVECDVDMNFTYENINFHSNHKIFKLM